MSEIQKTDDQIAKDKESVARMNGAKAAMEAALRRIDVLEKSLDSVKRQAEAIGKAFNDEVHIRVYDHSNSNYAVVKVRTLFDNIGNTIKSVR